MGKKFKKNKKSDPTMEIEKLKNKLSLINSTENIKKFCDLPLSERTLQGLSQWEYVTDIQREAILPTLKGQDLLAAAKTGSGKTLAFLIPMVELLYWERITGMDGLAGLIISPTRELAMQIMSVVEVLTSFHVFSRGLLIGGEKKEAMRTSNIVVATPGRLLQQMEESDMSCESLRILILDEADRILDMGFASTLNSILSYLPKQRQTLLFSATQTKCVADLGRLSLTSPLYISVHEMCQYPTPNALKQTYITTKDKLSLLWTFVKKHSHCSNIVFFSTCKQVKYIHSLFKTLGTANLLCLHGGMKQHYRYSVYSQFGEKSTLFATDLAARGLDFSHVDWVVQFDCPDSLQTYIHRVGRTARCERKGHSLLLLTDHQGPFTNTLHNHSIPITETRANSSLLDEHFTSKVQACCAKNPELNEMSKKAVVSYAKWLYYASDKQLFDINQLDLADYSKSMGLSLTPRLRFLGKREEKNEEKYSLSDAKRRMEEADISDTIRHLKKKKKSKSKRNIDSYLSEKPLSEIEKLASQFI